MTEAQAQELGPTGRPLRVYPDPAPLSNHGPARIISMVNQKGGVGKTTSTINLGAALAECGRKVLLVDFDPQGALSAGFGANPHELDLTVYNVMMDRKVDIKDVILPTGVENIDLLPANIDLSAAEVQLVNEVAREQVLASALRKVRDEYDVILIDCQPSLGMLTVNALAAANRIIVPVQAEYLPAKGLEQLLSTISKVKRQLNPKLQIDGILLTMVDSRTNFAKEIAALLRETYGSKIKVFGTEIPHSVRAKETSAEGKSIFAHDPGGKVAEGYRNLTKEVLKLEKQREKSRAGLGR